MFDTGASNSRVKRLVPNNVHMRHQTAENGFLRTYADFRNGSSRSRWFLHGISKTVAGFGLAAVTASAATVVIPGFLKYEYFPGATRGTVEAGTATPSLGYSVGVTVGADGNALITTFESAT